MYFYQIHTNLRTCCSIEMHVSLCENYVSLHHTGCGPRHWGLVQRLQKIVMYSFDYRLGVKKLQIRYNNTHIMSCDLKQKQNIF